MTIRGNLRIFELSNDRQNAHNDIDHIFPKTFFPPIAMPERPGQIALSHVLGNAMLAAVSPLRRRDGDLARPTLLVAGTGVSAVSGPPRPSSFLLPALLFKRNTAMNTCFLSGPSC